MHMDSTACQKLSFFPLWAFLFGFVCRDLGLFFYLFGVRCWFCYLCFVVPIAPIPSCFDGRSAILLGFYYITLAVPEMMNLTVESSQAGPSSDPSRFLYLTLVFNLFHMTYIPLIHATGYISSIVSTYPLSVLLIPHRWFVP